MVCPNCQKEVVADRLFCTWCESYIPNHLIGTKAGFFRRWVAAAIDPFLGFILYFSAIALFGGGSAATMGDQAGTTMVILVSIGYMVFFIIMLSKGMTPGKWLLRERVVEKLTGRFPGFWRMVLREIFGKIVSSLLAFLGFFWAIWDKDNQAWHDKIAGTVVIRKRNGEFPGQILVAVPAVTSKIVTKGNTVYCTNCGESSDGGKFCSSCGQPLS